VPRTPSSSSGDQAPVVDGPGPDEPTDDQPPGGLEQIVSSIGPKLRELRVQRGLSLQQLADRADVSAAAIHKIERSGMVPTITTLLKIAGALNRPVSYFVNEDQTAWPGSRARTADSSWPARCRRSNRRPTAGTGPWSTPAKSWSS
jgi:DNA-binding XRE family transcriptional regulator